MKPLDWPAIIYQLNDAGVEHAEIQQKTKIAKSTLTKIMRETQAHCDEWDKALAKAGLTIDQIDIIELNEAFAAQSIACIRELGLQDNDPRINPNGGAIAIGHPLGVTGARICYSAALELQLTGKRYALITMCIGVGQGYSAIIERV